MGWTARVRPAFQAARPLALAATLAFAQAPAFAQEDVEPSEPYQQPYVFSTDWFTRHIPVWERLFGEYAGKPNVNYLEVGLWEGRSALWMLENILTHETSRLTGVDIFGAAGLEERWLTNLEMSGQAERATTMKSFSFTAMRSLPLHSFDIIYVDGSHDANDVLADAVLAWGLLKPGGILLFDDYEHRREKPPELRPDLAIDAFLTTHRNFIEILERDYQIALRKVAGPCPNRTDCFQVGKHVYSWGARRLFDADGKPVELTDDERKLVQEFIKARPFGSTEYAPTDAMRADAGFQALCKKLGWEF